MSLDLWLQRKANQAIDDLKIDVPSTAVATTSEVVATSTVVVATTTTPTTKMAPTTQTLNSTQSQSVTTVVMEPSWWSEWWKEHRDVAQVLHIRILI